MTDVDLPERLHDLAHLGHHALFTSTPDRSLAYFVDLLGMDVVEHEGDTFYLRTFGDYERWSLKLIASDKSGLDYMSWRVSSPAALERRVAWLEGNGHGGIWLDPEFGIGRSYAFDDPDGHHFRIYYDTDRYMAEGDKVAVLPTNFQAYAGRGANVRHLDHVNLLARDVRACRIFWEQGFGLRTYEIRDAADGVEDGAWMSSSIQGHELIYTQEHTSGSGRLHHVAYVVDSREDSLRAAAIFADARIYIEAGPSQHTAIQGFYLYTREPGGNRIEVANGGYLRFAPDQKPYVWSPEAWAAKPGWGAPIPDQFHIYGTPDID